jgi:hypothetical protein
MTFQGELGEGEKEGIAPSGVECGVGVEEERDEGANVLHSHCLGV